MRSLGLCALARALGVSAQLFYKAPEQRPLGGAPLEPMDRPDQQPVNSAYGNGHLIKPPLLGFGTWQLTESFENTSAAVAHAIEVGYRHIDCAWDYGNHKAVGHGIKEGMKRAGITREDLWITSKVWNDHHRPWKVWRGLDKTRKQLGVEYIDEYLMHWPVGNTGQNGHLAYDYVETWKAMEPIIVWGKARMIGVSNFSPDQLRHLMENSEVKPHVHQMELHPYLQQSWWVDWHKKHGIHVTAYSPLGNLNPTYGERDEQAQTLRPPLLLEDQVLNDIAERRGCTVPQVALAWGMIRGTSVIPKSKHPKWIEENFESLKCELSEKDLEEIADLRKKHVKRYNNPGEDWGVRLFQGLDDA